MIATCQRGVEVLGVGSHLPERVMTNDEIATMVETSDEWIASRTGIRERRIAADGESSAGLGADAALRALESAGIAGSDLDLIVAATASPDYYFPATATLIGERIGARGVAGYDLSAACTGFVYALAQAYGQVAAGLADTALVVGTEVFSRLLDWGDRSTCVLFGDGAGAVVLRRNGSTTGLLGFELGSDGRGQSCSRWPPPGTHGSRGDAVRAHGRPAGLQVRDDGVGRVGDPRSHGGRPHRRRCRRLRPPPGQPAHHRPRRAAARAVRERVVSNVDRYGNTSAASIPICLDEAHRDGRIKAGDIVLMVGLRRRPLVGLVRDGMDTPSEGDEDEQGRVLLPGAGKPARGHGPGSGLAQFPEAAAVFDQASSDELDFDLRKVCFDGPIEELSETEVTQPALVATSLPRCAPIQERLGIEPDVVVGHSVGEYAAIAAADESVDVGLVTRLVRERGLAMAASKARGAMAAVLGLADEEVERLCAETDDVWPANYNCPGQLVISGREAGVAARRREGARAGREGGPAARLGRVPQPARRGCGAPPRAGAARGAHFGELKHAVHVHGVEQARDGRPRARPPGRADHRSGAVHAGRCRRSSPTACARSSRSARAGCSAGLVKRIDRSVTAISIGTPEELRAAEASIARS